MAKRKTVDVEFRLSREDFETIEDFAGCSGMPTKRLVKQIVESWCEFVREEREARRRRREELH